MISAKEQPGTTPFNADPLAGQMLDADAHMYLTAKHRDERQKAFVADVKSRSKIEIAWLD